MPYFLISIDVNAWDQHTFDVDAPTSGAALVRVLEHLDAIKTERVLHGIHVGPASDRPFSKKERAELDNPAQFTRLL